MKNLILVTVFLIIGAVAGGCIVFSEQTEAADTPVEQVTIEKDGMIEITEKRSIITAEYILLLKGQKAHQEGIIAFAQAKLDKINAELAKYEIKK